MHVPGVAGMRVSPGMVCPAHARIPRDACECLRTYITNAYMLYTRGTISDRTLFITRIPYSLSYIRFIGVPRLHRG